VKKGTPILKSHEERQKISRHDALNHSKMSPESTQCTKLV